MEIELEISKKVFNSVYFPYLFNYEHRFEVYYGGAGSGKSVFVCQKLLVKAIQDKRKVLVIRKTQVSQKESCWRLFLETLSKWQLLDKCKVNKSDYTIELPNGSLFLFKGLDDPEKIKSIVGITDIWTEEATELTLEDFEQLDLRLRASVDNQQIYVSFNPISKANWVYKRWFEKENIDNDVFILKTTYKDNRFLPAEYINSLEAKINTNPTYYRIYALGEFCSLDRLVYTNWKVEDFDYTKLKGELIIGLDYGFQADPSALVASIVDQEEKKIYIFKEWVTQGKTNNELADGIKALGFSKSIIIADSAEPKSIEEMKRLGIYRIKPSVKGQDSIIHGIQKVQQYQLIVHPSCETVITELENYAWQKDKSTGEYINKPVDTFNHAMDALRYSLQCISTNKLKTVSKLKLGL